MKTARKAHDRNQAVKSALKTYIARFEEGLEKGPDEAKKALDIAVRALDKAAAKGVIHKNGAANTKSALMKKYNALLAAPPKPAEAPAKKAPAKKTAKKPAKKAVKRSAGKTKKSA